MQDTINHNTDSVVNNQIDEPLFIIPDSLQNQNKTIGFKQYLQNLNELFPAVVERKSLFREKNFYVGKDMRVREREVNKTEAWVFGIIILLFLVYSVLIRAFRHKIKYVFKGVYSHTITLTVAMLLFAPIFALMVCTPIDYYEYLRYSPFKSSFLTYLLILLASILFFSLKYMLIYFFGLSFRLENICNKYNYNQVIFYFIDGLILLPILFLYYFLPETYEYPTMIVLFIVAGILLLTRLIIGFSLVFVKVKISKFYLFVYLCTLEIVPLIIIYKYIFSY